MAHHDPEALAHEERRYLQIFLILGILTVVEIGVIYMPIPHFLIAMALVIFAATKAALVALYYMHLANERNTLTWIALTPAILCVFLLLMLTPDLGALTRILTHAVVDAPAAAEH
ncbi:MAG TPA: cytochrome C oxidase subunit IV family protein [Candidatus Eisenbacteria bacterium]|nr:cytochrome C oxidase subunit IV family protein [Candidatus Eisenbacteria bacterium]